VKIVINSQEFDVVGSSIVSKGGQIIVDGNVVVGGLSGTVKIEWKGELASLRADGAVNCEDVHGNVDAGGSVTCQKVTGSVDAGGSVTCENIGGNVDAGGPVSCGSIGGNVDAASVQCANVGSVKM